MASSAGLSGPSRPFFNWWPRALGHAAPVLFLVVGIVGLFFFALGNYFALDDFFLLFVGRFNMSQLTGWIAAFTANVGPFYRPLGQNVFFWLSWHLFGFNPLGYHLFCAGALVAAACVAYAIYLKILRAPAAALAAGSIFAFSSTHYEAAAWAAAFDEASAAAAFAISILSYLSGKIRLSVIWYIVALLCDESATPLPLIALVLSILVHRVGARDSVKRSLPLWIAFGAYVAFRLKVTGLGFGTAGPFGVNVAPSLYISLIYHAFVNGLGAIPSLQNVLSSNAPWGPAAKLVWALYAMTLLLVAGVALANHRRAAVLRIGAAGLLWFAIALCPMLVFSAHNWSLYDLEIPLMGLALAVGSLWEGLNHRISLAAAGAVACLFLVVNGLVIYGPGGLNEIDGAIRQGNAAKALYGLVSWAIHSRVAGDDVTVNVVAPAADVDVAGHVGGWDYGAAVLGEGLSAAPRMVFSSHPIAHSTLLLAWSGAAYQYELLRTDGISRSAACSRSPVLCAQFPGMAVDSDGAYTGSGETTSVRLYKLAKGIPFVVSGSVAQGTATAGTLVALGDRTNGYGMFFYYDHASGRDWVACQKFVGGVETNIGGYQQVGVPDTEYHTFRFLITPHAKSNSLEAYVGTAHIMPFLDSSLNLTEKAIFVMLSSGSNATRYKNLNIGGV